MNTKVDEGKLISGKEALIALANGDEVQIWNGNIWWDVEGDYQIDVFLKTERKFRLKPLTLLINGKECPAPILWDSLPNGTKFWIADPSRHDGEFCRYLVWDGQDCDVQHLQRGLVHLSKQDAVEHAKAIILASGGSYE